MYLTTINNNISLPRSYLFLINIFYIPLYLIFLTLLTSKSISITINSLYTYIIYYLIYPNILFMQYFDSSHLLQQSITRLFSPLHHKPTLKPPLNPKYKSNPYK